MSALSSSESSTRASAAKAANTRTRALAAGLALVSVVLAVALARFGFQPRAGTGFAQVAGTAVQCALGTPAAQSRVREPNVLPSRAPRSCYRWQAFWAVSRLRRSSLELDATGRADLFIDGHRVGLWRGSRGLSGLVTLRPGVHSFDLQFLPADAKAYLRVREQDQRDSYYPYVVDPLRQQDFFVQRTAAQAALVAPAPARSWLPPLCTALLLLACVAAWLAVRAKRGRSLPWLALLCTASIVLGAYGVRIAQLPFDGTYTDELAYATAGRHYVRNVQLGDFSNAAFRWNYEHPPVAKWIYGAAAELGGQDGARRVSALLAACACGLTVVLGTLLLSLRVGVSAGALCSLMPQLVAHARLTGLESPVVFFWMATLLAAVTWARSTQLELRAGGQRAGDALAAFLMVALSVLGLGSRMTCVWLAPILLCVMGYVWLRSPWQQALRTLALAAVGGAIAVLVLYALWPWLWTRPLEGWHQILARWGGQHTSEFFMGENRRPPPPRYYLLAFAATTPLAVLVLAGLGSAIGVLRRRWRVATVFLVLCLGAPFLQSISVFRQDLARYVIPAWFALALLAALGVDELVTSVSARLLGASRPRVSFAASVSCHALLAAYVGLALARVEPYPLDYFGELVGGPQGVYATRSFELAWWGEGIGEAVAWLNEHAPRAARLRTILSPGEVRPRVRDDIVEPRGPVNFVISNHYKFRDEHPHGCTLAHRVSVQGAPLVDVFKCAGK